MELGASYHPLHAGVEPFLLVVVVGPLVARHWRGSAVPVVDHPGGPGPGGISGPGNIRSGGRREAAILGSGNIIAVDDVMGGSDSRQATAYSQLSRAAPGGGGNVEEVMVMPVSVTVIGRHVGAGTFTTCRG